MIGRTVTPDGARGLLSRVRDALTPAVAPAAALALLALAGPGVAAQETGVEPTPTSTSERGAGTPQLSAARDTSLAAALEEVHEVFDKEAAWKLLEAIDPFYRVRGNQGYLRSLERCFLVMREAGFADPSGLDGPPDTVRYADYGPVKPAWTPTSASLSVVSPDVGVLHEFENESGHERTFLCVNSFPTPPQGIVAPLVSFDHNRPPETYAGTIVFSEDLPASTLFERAVRQGGALGVISGYLPDYNDPDRNRDAIRYSSIPYDPERKGFGLNVSPAKRDVLERLLDGGLVYVKVNIRSRFNEARSRTLVGQIRGTDDKAGAIALVAHLDEPGANDNGSGVAATVGMATGYLRALQEGRLPRPRRSVVFLIGTEFECSREWLRAYTGEVDMALIIDMVGEAPDSNGATPLVERMPDPGAIWDRAPLDIHSEWGRSDVRESDLVGSYLNDYVLAAMKVRRDRVDWPVRSNPYEGGSDHESFLERGIPAVLLWHFTDPYYHTNLDRLDKVSLDEMENVAIATLGLVHHYAEAGMSRAEEVLEIVMKAARLRLETEAASARERLGLPAVKDDPVQLALVSDRERGILVAWSRWYREAVLSMEDFQPGYADPEAQRLLEEHIDRALADLRVIEREALASLKAVGG